MLRAAKHLRNFTLGAIDGEIGRIKDFYFDDEKWTVRYLVTDTGSWLTGRQVLISPYSLGRINESERRLDVSLTKKQIEESPSVESDKPVSRQFEIDYYRHYGWPAYWYGPALWGPTPYPIYYGPGGERLEMKPDRGDPHLRSIRDVSGYGIRARDKEIGEVHDFLIDDRSWAIRYLVVDTRKWLPGKKVLMAPLWIDRVSWREAVVHVELRSETIKQAPPYDADHPVTRQYEASLFQHYNREGYWVREQEQQPELAGTR